ncbi:MAG TPA: FliG C-terminal domain-containing protein [Spirochaetales bacterium]|nr:FliG C-terminal domain-containing protein [Spirochaetales bacterium]
MPENLGRFLEDTEHNNIVIQLAIRQVDTRDFIACLVGLDDQSRQALYRNISKRAYEAVQKDMEADAGTLGPGAIASAVSTFKRLLARFDRIERSAQPPTPEYSSRPESLFELAANFIHLALMVDGERYDDIQALSDASPDAFTRLGLRLVADQTDPLQARIRLERLKAAMLADEERRLDLALEGFDSVLSHDRPGLTAEKVLDLAGQA